MYGPPSKLWLVISYLIAAMAFGIATAVWGKMGIVYLAGAVAALWCAAYLVFGDIFANSRNPDSYDDKRRY